MRPRKRCNVVGCNEFIDYAEKFCEKHKNWTDRQYNKNRHKVSKRDDEIAKFYSSVQWRKVRESALIRDHYLCQCCLKNGMIKPAEIVHHKVEVRDVGGWDRRFNVDNLESVCLACHNKIHGEERWRNKIE